MQDYFVHRLNVTPDNKHWLLTAQNCSMDWPYFIIIIIINNNKSSVH